MRNSAGMFGRLRGDSDVLYIGSSESSLKQRLRFYLHPGPTQITNIRINAMLDLYNVEVTWMTTDQPQIKESELLQEYFYDHDELPPFNAQGARVTASMVPKKPKKMGNRERVLDFLEKSEHGICDDCLSNKLDIKPRQTINRIARNLRDAGWITREIMRCPNCSVRKTVNEIESRKSSARTFIKKFIVAESFRSFFLVLPLYLNTLRK